MDKKIGIHISKASGEDIMCIHNMAQVVFRHTYREILSPEQMEYMMEWMYSPANLQKQLDEDMCITSHTATGSHADMFPYSPRESPTTVACSFTFRRYMYFRQNRATDSAEPCLTVRSLMCRRSLMCGKMFM